MHGRGYERACHASNYRSTSTTNREYSTAGVIFPTGLDAYGSKSLIWWWPGAELNHRHADFQPQIGGTGA